MTEHAPGERMSSAEFRAAYEYLGLTAPWMTRALDVTERTVRSWASGRHAVPDGVRDEVERWMDEAASAVDQIVEAAMDAPDPVVCVPATDDDAPDGWPARWWRHVAMRAVDEVPGLRLVYADESD